MSVLTKRALRATLVLAILASCSTRRPLVGSDSGPDGSSSVLDGGSDAGRDAAVVTMGDAGHDAAALMFDASRDAGSDAGHDAGNDAGRDGGRDGGRDAATVASSAPLIFSEYIEGTGNNHAIEIANVSSGGTFSLTGCSVTLYANGATATTATFPLTGSLAAGAVFTICSSTATGFTPSTCDASIAGGVTGFNGNDALALDCADGRVDVIGEIGNDPGSAGWGTSVTTTDETLRRQCTVTMGDSNGTNAFDPAGEWTSAGVDVFGGLGTYGCP